MQEDLGKPLQVPSEGLHYTWLSANVNIFRELLFGQRVLANLTPQEPCGPPPLVYLPFKYKCAVRREKYPHLGLDRGRQQTTSCRLFELYFQPP